MQKLILYIKSYKPDFNRLETLLHSIEKFNQSGLPVYISVNDPDFSFFKERLPAGPVLVKDSEIVDCRIADGWRYQQVVKAQFYRLGVCENYLCIDSDSEFIRPFSQEDFMYDSNTPYTVMHEGKEFLDMMEIIGRGSADLFRTKALASIRQRFGTHGKNWDYGPSPYLWCSRVWKSFHEEWLPAQGHDFETFFNEMEKVALPSEAVMYGEYLRMTKLMDIIPVEGFFKVYHYREQFELEKKWFDRERLSRNYMGIIMQSNWHAAKKKRLGWL